MGYDELLEKYNYYKNEHQLLTMKFKEKVREVNKLKKEIIKLENKIKESKEEDDLKLF